MHHQFQNHHQNLLNVLKCLSTTTDSLCQVFERGTWESAFFVNIQGNSWPVKFWEAQYMYSILIGPCRNLDTLILLWL